MTQEGSGSFFEKKNQKTFARVSPASPRQPRSGEEVKVTAGRVNRARAMRREATEAEKVLWQLLRARQHAGVKFRRQHPVGPFIADVACIERRLIVEADGGQHDGSAGDARRTAWLEAAGWRVIRFWNNEILGNPEGVLRAIEVALMACARRAPSPSQR